MRVDFRDLKSKVGIDDIAHRLGYLIDKKAGLGRYIEMVDPNSADRIIIKNPHDRANQTYFRRDGRKGGDVISFIQENLTALGQGGKNQWEAIIQVLADFSNTYITPSRSYLEEAGYKGVQVFDKSRYDTQPIQTDLVGVARFFESRGLHLDTVTVFAYSIVRIKDLHNTAYNSYNIAFPYVRPSGGEVAGFEIRGYKGFKSKAAGTDSSNAAWIVDLSTDKNPLSKKYVFFTESAFDTMAFYQANKNRLNLENSVFVSIGGTFSENQIKSIMKHYANAKAVDCFDNDIAGKLYGVRMLCILNDTKLESNRTETTIQVKINGKVRSFQEKDLTPANVAKEFNLNKNVYLWKSPLKYKDWNDAILEKPLVQKTSKYEQKERLHQQRKLKL